MAITPQKADRIYIIPTRHGFSFLGLFFVMVLVASGSGNNLIYGLAFVLFGVFFFAMIATHRNLKAIEIDLLDCEDGFAGEMAKVHLTVSNPAARPRFLIRAKARHFSVSEKVELGELTAGSRLVVDVPLILPQRGEYDVPQIQISTIYPLGLFWAWTNMKFSGQLYIYPKREGQGALKPEYFGEGSGDKRGQWAETQHEDFREHARYQTGESHHHVDWKAYARRRVLLSKRYEATSPQHFVLDWQGVRQLGSERALSQMSEWLAKLQTSGNTFEIRIPGTNSGKGRGWHHGKVCLRALARYPKDAA